MASWLKRAIAPVLLLLAWQTAFPASLEEDIRKRVEEQNWSEALKLLAVLRNEEPARYIGRDYDFLTGWVLAALGRTEEAVLRFERFLAVQHPLERPSRLALSRIFFSARSPVRAVELSLPLIRTPGPVQRHAIRMVTRGLEREPDPAAIALLSPVKGQLPARDRRRIELLEAERLEAEGQADAARTKLLALLRESKRDDTAALIFSRRFPRVQLENLDAVWLEEYFETARKQRDFLSARKTGEERLRRIDPAKDPNSWLGALFELARIRATQGLFAEAERDYRALLARENLEPRALSTSNDPPPGTSAFFARVRFNLAAILERSGRADEAAREFALVEQARAPTSALAAFQRARIEIRLGRLSRAENILRQPFLTKRPGRVEGLLHLLDQQLEHREHAGALRTLSFLDSLARKRQLPDPFQKEMAYWRGRVAESRGAFAAALAHYSLAVSLDPSSFVSGLAAERVQAFPPVLRVQLLAAARSRPARRGEPGNGLLAAARFGDTLASQSLRSFYEKKPAYARILTAPQLSEGDLVTLCGETTACRLFWFGLFAEAAPFVREGRDLSSVPGCLLAELLAEKADAGTAALEAAEALDRLVPRDFFLPLAAPPVLRALAPRPFHELVRTASEETGVGEDVIYGVMKRESRFDPEALSPAVARGLMQMTLPAVLDATPEAGENHARFESLYEPAVSIQMGSRTLKQLAARFRGDIPSAVSAYNAGPGQTILWTGLSKTPASTLLASISYPETRTYLRHVLANRWLYQLAYPVPATASQAARP